MQDQFKTAWVQTSGPWVPWQASEEEKKTPWCTSRSCRVQNSGPWVPWLPGVENSRLSAQRTVRLLCPAQWFRILCCTRNHLVIPSSCLRSASRPHPPHHFLCIHLQHVSELASSLSFVDRISSVPSASSSHGIYSRGCRLEGNYTGLPTRRTLCYGQALALCAHCVCTACILRTQRPGYSPKNTCHLSDSK